jgi:hypothetical protein
MLRRNRKHRSLGQALVEFTLAATLIFTLLSAAVDLGLIFFTLQAMQVAAQEGATFGSHPVETKDSNGMITKVDLPYTAIVDRVRYAGGTGPSGFANLLDLNNDGIDDSGQPTIIDPTSASSYIYVENIRDTDGDFVNTPSNTACATNTAGQGLRNAAKYCYIRVTVSYNYKFFFPLAPVFADTIRLKISSIIQVRYSLIG